MNADAMIRRLAVLPGALSSMLRALTEEEHRWKPPAGAWSILEIVRHLVDEEVEDFRGRMRAILEGTPMGRIDPEGWAKSRGYNEGDASEALAALTRERGASLAWLESLHEPDWSLTARTPGGFDLRAGELLGAWAAHDALHLRQIAKRLWELAGRDAEPYSTRYAGEWKA